MRRKGFGSRIHALVPVEEPAHITRKLTVFRRPSGVQRGGSMAVGSPYLLPPLGAKRDKCR